MNKLHGAAITQRKRQWEALQILAEAIGKLRGATLNKHLLYMWQTFYSNYLKRREENTTSKMLLKQAGERKENLAPYSLAQPEPDRSLGINCF